MKELHILDFPPLVTVLNDEKRLVTVQVTKCDNCHKSLLNKKRRFKWNKVHVIDDAVRCMYFCSEKCRDEILAKKKSNHGHFPNELLSIHSLR